MTEAEPGAPASASTRATDPATRPPAGEAAELIELVDRLESLLEHSGLAELEVEAGGTGILLRSPAPVVREARTALEPAPAVGGSPSNAAPAVGAAIEDGADTLHAVVAPLTGIFYAAPTPEAAPYVAVGDTVGKGQVIGLIEAMKLFNEIKSDVAGRVVRIAAETGSLVKARQPLIELDLA